MSVTLVVNTAFLAEIKDSNTTLWYRLQQIRDGCESRAPRSVVLHQLVELLNEVRDLLGLQFALEESYGYMEVASHPNGGVTVPAEQVRTQHCSLYLALNELAERAEELQYRGWVSQRVDDLIAQVKWFDLQLQDHERFERQLLENARTAAHRTV